MCSRSSRIRLPWKRLATIDVRPVDSIVLGIAFGIMTAACAPQPVEVQGGQKMEQLVTLHAVDPKDDHISISVTGYGCTVARQFKIEAVQEDAVCRVSIYRTQFDRCRRSPLPKTLKIPWNAEQACGDAPIEIVNPQKPAPKVLLIVPDRTR